MTNEKLIIVVIRVKKDDQREKSVPLSFKCKESEIPQGINTKKVQAKNLVYISLDFAEKIPALVIALADDSSELMADYKRFCEISKSTKMPPIESKTIHLINISGLQIDSSKQTSLTSIPLKKFKAFMQRIDELKEIQKKSYNTRQVKPANNKQEEKDSSRKTKPKKLVELSSEDESQKPSTSKTQSKIVSKQTKPKTPPKKNDKNDPDSNQNPNLKNRDRIMTKLQQLANHVEPMEESIHKQSFEDIIKIFYIFAKSLVPESHIKEDDSIRIIPENDSTKVDGDFTVIEGLLPVYTKQYKKAIFQKTFKEGEKEPTVLLANIVRYAFPSHWIQNVTIRGWGGRKSIVSLWNYENPHNEKVEGDSSPGLGDKRFRALLDHVVRKCGKKSYDAGTEKTLTATFAKALHYSRTHIIKPSKKDGQESSESDSNSDYSSEDDGSVKLVCTPDIYESEENDTGDDSDEESLVNSIFDAPTIVADSSHELSGNEKNKNLGNMQRPAKKIIERIKDVKSKKKPNESSSSPNTKEVTGNKNQLLKNDSSGKFLNNADKKSQSPSLTQKFESVKNYYYNGTAGGSKRSTNDSAQIGQNKKSRKSDESENIEQVNNDKIKNKSLIHGMLSQDESKLKYATQSTSNLPQDSAFKPTDENDGHLDLSWACDDLWTGPQEDELEDGEVTDE